MLTAAPALAHITVNPSEAAQGSFAKLTFRVPNEQDTGDTIKLEVQFPTDHPIASVSVKPHGGGWVADVQTVSDAVSQITWSGGKIAPGEFDEFEVSVGPLPDVDSLKFPTVQTYSDGNVVSWIQDTTPGGPEPEFPAPVLTLTAAGPEADHHGGDSSSSESSSSSSSSPSVSVAGATIDHKEDSSDGLAIAALVLAIVALLIGGIGLFRPRKSTPAS